MLIGAHYGPMTFQDIYVTFNTRAAPVHVRVTGDALYAMWGDHTGPQTAEGLIAANLEMIEELAGDKLILGQAEGGIVTISGFDIER